jgi:hypothetical protein
VSKDTQPQRDPSVTAVIHGAGGDWRVIVATNGRGGPTIVAEQTFDAASRGRIEPFLDEHAAGRVIDVVPASHIVCRTCTLPNVDVEQIAQALDLQAETFLPGNAPSSSAGPRAPTTPAPVATVPSPTPRISPGSPPSSGPSARPIRSSGPITGPARSPSA